MISAAWRAVAMVALAIGGADGGSAATAARVEEVQALFVLNLTRFVRWPAEAFAAEDSALVIGVQPLDPVGVLLRRLAVGEKSGERPIEIRDLNSPADIDGCHLVYFSKEQTSEMVRWIGPLRTRPVLTVSDADGFLRLGGHVQLHRQGLKVRLRVNPTGMGQSGLQPSSQLLRVAGASAL